MSRLPPEESEHEAGNPQPQTLITIELLQRAKQGDPQALEHIMERYLPRLQRWARGRLPRYALPSRKKAACHVFMRVCAGRSQLTSS